MRDMAARTFGEVLRDERVGAGLTQEQLAERASLSARAISDLERGVKRTPRRQTVELLARALHLSPAGRTALADAPRSRRARMSGTPRTRPVTPLVGRARELARLETALAEASGGSGKTIFLSGEPGIGKTHLAECFASRAENGGAIVLWGRCYEGEVARPYGPWSEILSSYASTANPARLRELLGSGAPPLARLIPRIQAVLPETPRAADLGPEEERFRLHDAVAEFFAAIADAQPVVLVLEDLHWADGDSLRLLRHVARCASRTPLLLLGTYRDVEVDRRDPLVETLSILQHESDLVRLPLLGWTLEETATYLDVLAAQPLPQAFVRHIHHEAGGNPFYAREVFHHLVEEQIIVNLDARWSTDIDLRTASIPRGVRDVVTRRVARLSEAAHRLLRHGAAFTGGFPFGLMAGLTQLDELILLDALDEALDAGLIQAVEGVGETYAFTHAIMRQAVFDELSPSRKARLHRQIAVTLEALQPAPRDQVDAEIAAQYHASASLPGAERGVAYALRAAEQARASYALEQVVRLLRLARDLVPPDELVMRAEVLQRLALAEADAVLLDAAQGTLEAALETLAAAGADADAVAVFLEKTALRLKLAGAAASTWEPLVQRGLALLGERRDLVWARLSLLQDRYVAVSHGSMNAAHWVGHDQEAIALVRALGDEDDYARSLDPLAWRNPSQTADALAKVRTWTTPTAVLRGLNVVARDLFYRHGDFQAARERYAELLRTAQRYGSIADQAEALAQLAAVRVTLGDFVAAHQTLTQAENLVGRLGPAHRLHFVTLVGAPTILGYFTTADWPTLLERAQRYMVGPHASRSPLGLAAASYAALAYLRTGGTEVALHTIDSLVPVLQHLEPHFYMHNHVVSIVGAIVWELESRRHAPLLRRLAMELVDAAVAPGCLGAHELTVARMLALGGDHSETDAWFARARGVVDACAQRSMRPLVDLDEARVLLARGASDADRARRLLASATALFDDLGMLGWRERAAALAESMTSVPSQPPDGLTLRELEVLQLVAAGLTSKDIAARLVISVATVQRHIANVYTKIDARGRADATAYAMRHGLVRG